TFARASPSSRVGARRRRLHPPRAPRTSSRSPSPRPTARVRAGARPSQAPRPTTLTYAQQAADDTATGGTASLAPPGVVSDGQIAAWITDNGGFIEAIAAARGYDLAQLPAATAKDAMTLLAAVNKIGVQVLLGEAIAARAGITGAWQTLDNIRADYSDLVKSLRAGAYDKLFIANARTEDALPQLGGWVPGIAPRPCQHAAFRKDKL